MELFTGRLTANAVVNTLKNERQVVNFSVAINDYYKPKGDAEGKQFTTYINCAYWISAKVAAKLTKGAVVEIAGRLFVNAYLSGNEPKASLNCHVNHIKIHSLKTGAQNETVVPISTEEKTETADDLPF